MPHYHLGLHCFPNGTHLGVTCTHVYIGLNGDTSIYVKIRKNDQCIHRISVEYKYLNMDENLSGGVG